MNVTKYACVVLLCLLTPAAHSQAVSSSAATEPIAPHLTAQGHSEIKEKADVADLTIAVKVAARLETVAAEQNAARTTALVAKIRALPGVRREDIQTTDYTVTRQFSNADAPVFIGYVVINTVQVTLHDVREVSRLIDLTAGAGATRITGLNYTLADRQGAEQRALTLAVVNARERAQTIASALGMTLGHLRVVSDNGGGNIVYSTFGLDGVNNLTGNGAGIASTPISAQLVIVRADASVDYALEPQTPAP